MKEDARLWWMVMLGVLAAADHSYTALAWQSVAPIGRQQQLPQQQQRPQHRVVSALSPRTHGRFGPSSSFTTTSTMTTTLLRDAAAHFPGNSPDDSVERKKDDANGREGEPAPPPASSSPGAAYFAAAARTTSGGSSSLNQNKNHSSSPSSSLLRTIDNWGLGWKPKAVHANAKAALAETRFARWRYTLQSCALWTLFLVYRAYRGFFVIVPAVFRATFDKLQTVVDEAPFDDQYFYNSVSSSSSRDVRNPKQYPWRTRLTVSVLAAIVTVSYLLGGALRVGMHFVRSSWSNRDVPRSLQAAATEQERNEAKLLRLATTRRHNNNNNDDNNNATTRVNGQSPGLAP